MKKMISVVVPVYNEEEGILNFLERQLLPGLDGLKYETEVVLVNDGSRDKTLAKIDEFARRSGRDDVRVISFARNFGKEMARTAELNYAKGDAVVMIDGD